MTGLRPQQRRHPQQRRLQRLLRLRIFSVSPALLVQRQRNSPLLLLGLRLLRRRAVGVGVRLEGAVEFLGLLQQHKHLLSRAEVAAWTICWTSVWGLVRRRHSNSSNNSSTGTIS